MYLPTLEELDEIRNAIDTGGGQTCDVEGVLEELKKHGFVIRRQGNANS